MRSARVLLAALIVAAIGAGPAQAASDRDAAMQFGFAAYRARVALLADKPEVQRRFDALLNDDRCTTAIRHAPKRARRRLGELLGVGLIDALFVPLRPALDAFRADLDRVVTTDPILRSGRAAWRAGIGAYDSLPDLGDVCGTMDTWRRTGYARAQTPPLHLGAIVRLARQGMRTIQRKLDAAARRMRQLGVLRRDAHRFTGDPLFRGLEPDLGATPAPVPAQPPPV